MEWMLPLALLLPALLDVLVRWDYGRGRVCHGSTAGDGHRK